MALMEDMTVIYQNASQNIYIYQGKKNKNRLACHRCRIHEIYLTQIVHADRYM